MERIKELLPRVFGGQSPLVSVLRHGDTPIVPPGASFSRYFTHTLAAAGQYWLSDNFETDIPANQPFKIEVVCQPFFNAITSTQWIVSTNGAGGSHNPSIQCGSSNRVGYGMRWSDGTPVTKGNAFIIPAEYRSELLKLSLEWNGEVFVFEVNDGTIARLIEEPPSPGLTPQRDLRGIGLAHYLTGTSNFFDGIIDDVKVYENGTLKCHYRLDQQNSDVIYDLVSGLPATGYNLTAANTERFTYVNEYWQSAELFNPNASYFEQGAGSVRLGENDWAGHAPVDASHVARIRLNHLNIMGSSYVVDGECYEGSFNMSEAPGNQGLRNIIGEDITAPFIADKRIITTHRWGSSLDVVVRNQGQGDVLSFKARNLSYRRAILGSAPSDNQRLIYNFSAAAGQYVEVPEFLFSHGDYFEVEFKGQINSGGATLLCKFGEITNRISFFNREVYTSQTVRTFSIAEFDELTNGDIQSIRIFANRSLAWNVGRRNRINFGAARTSGASAFTSFNRIGSQSNNTTSVPGWNGLLFDVKVRINGELVRHYPMDDDPASPIFRELISGAHGQKVNFNGTEAQLFSVTGNKAINMTTKQEIIIR